MKADLRLESHVVIGQGKVIEVWWEGKMIMCVYGADGPGIRVVSKHALEVLDPGPNGKLNVVEVRKDSP